MVDFQERDVWDVGGGACSTSHKIGPELAEGEEGAGQELSCLLGFSGPAQAAPPTSLLSPPATFLRVASFCQRLDTSRRERLAQRQAGS